MVHNHIDDVFEVNPLSIWCAGGVPVEFRLPARLDSLPVIRTLMTAIGAHEELGLDLAADLRLALDEASTALIRSAVQGSRLVVAIDPGQFDVRITVSAPCVRDDPLRPGMFSWLVVSSLTDDLVTFRNHPEPGEPSETFGITMTARRPGT